MRHPTTPCPDALKPVFAEALKMLKRDLQAIEHHMPMEAIYICRILYDAANQTPLSESSIFEAEDFIDACLNPTGEEDVSSFDDWLDDSEDPEYERLKESARSEHVGYANKCRVKWLEFLVGEVK